MRTLAFATLGQRHIETPSQHPSQEHDLEHGSVALNDFEDCDFGLAYGFAFKNVSKLEDDARTIFGSNEIARKRWCSAQNHNELYQGVERLRLCRNPGRTLVVYGPVYPFDLLGQPSRHYDLRQETRYTASELAAERIIEFMAVTGIRAACKRIAWLLNICHYDEKDRMLRLQSDIRAKNEIFTKNPKMLALQAFQPPESAIIYSSSFRGLEPTDDVGLRDLATKTIFKTLAGTEALELVTSSDANFWNDVWKEVVSRKQELRKLKVKHLEIDKRNFATGVGSIEGGEALDQVLQVFGLKPGIWTE